MVDQRSHLFSYSIFDRKQFLQLTTNLIKIRFPGFFFLLRFIFFGIVFYFILL